MKIAPGESLEKKAHELRWFESFLYISLQNRQSCTAKWLRKETLNKNRHECSSHSSFLQSFVFALHRVYPFSFSRPKRGLQREQDLSSVIDSTRSQQRVIG